MNVHKQVKIKPISAKRLLLFLAHSQDYTQNMYPVPLSTLHSLLEQSPELKLLLSLLRSFLQKPFLCPCPPLHCELATVMTTKTALPPDVIKIVCFVPHLQSGLRRGKTLISIFEFGNHVTWDNLNICCPLLPKIFLHAGLSCCRVQLHGAI